VLRALALGARSCMIAALISTALAPTVRPAWTKAIDNHPQRVDVSMALCGVNSVKEIGRQVIVTT